MAPPLGRPRWSSCCCWPRAEAGNRLHPRRRRDIAAVTAPSAETATEPSLASAPDPYAAYEVADADVRCDTYMKGAALILPNPADMVQTLFAESGVRYARLAAHERFGQCECGGVSEDVARPWVILSARELAAHAPTLLRASGLRWVVFCAGLSQRGQPRSAVPGASSGIFLLDALNAGPEAYFQGTIHNELFHMLDDSERRLYTDAEWSRLNRQGRATAAEDERAVMLPGGSGRVPRASSPPTPSRPWRRTRPRCSGSSCWIPTGSPRWPPGMRRSRPSGT